MLNFDSYRNAIYMHGKRLQKVFRTNVAIMCCFKAWLIGSNTNLLYRRTDLS